MAAEATVFVVDDDEDLRRSLQWTLHRVGYDVRAYASAEAFLEAYDPAVPGCLLLDLSMPGMGGLALQQRMAELGFATPIVVMTGHADVGAAVRTLEAGAVGFVEKPFTRERLLERIRRAVDVDASARSDRAERAGFEARVAGLTPREREVMEAVVAGKPTKQIARALGTSDRTIESHRSRVMKKMGVDSIARLAAEAARCGLCREPPAPGRSAG